MQFRYKLISSQDNFVHNFIHFKLITSIIIKILEYYLIEFLIFNEL